MDPLLRNNVLVTGAGRRTLVFSHGFGCDLTAWAEVAPAFEAESRVVLFDHMGAGRSDLSAYDPGKYASFDGYAEDVAGIAAALDLADAVFVGHSVASMIGLLAALKAPGRFGTMVMLCASPRYVNEPAEGYVGGFSRADIDDLLEVLDSNFLGWSRAAAPAIMGADQQPSLGRALSDSFCRTNPEIAKAFARVTFLSDMRSMLPRLRLPTLILQTRADMIVPLEVGEYMHAAMADSRLVVMDATGHCPHLSAPGETIAAIRQYLAS